MKLFIVIFVAVSLNYIDCQPKCDPCPTNCEYGTSRTILNGECKCTCAVNPCDSMKCPINTSCRLRKEVNCQGESCQTTKRPLCVSHNKPGVCPAPDSIDETNSLNCEDDSHCDGNFKCCASLTQNTCSKPCAKTMCKCLQNTVVKETFNKQGCPFCSCVAPTNETNNDVCTLPKNTGNCTSELKRFYYDTTLKKCTPFTFTGCGGNGNNFQSFEFCQRRCLPELYGFSYDKTVARCFKDSDTGPCKALFNRYFYNSKNKKCEKFIYGGCDGNDNNFISEDECNQNCTNLIKTVFRSRILEKCLQAPSKGMCKGNLKRYFYNDTSKQCEKFIYGGCKGNLNNFQTFDECDKQCNLKVSKTEKTICHLDKVVGRCRGSYVRFYFNKDTRKCEEFIYGGCDGNENNFETLDACNDICAEESKRETEERNVCKQDMEVGPCRGAMKRFFFNSTSQACQEFIYGGCKGNENNFLTSEDCNQACASYKKNLEVRLVEPDTCLMKMDEGPCYAAFKRFFYNGTSQKCQEFIYGGCQGNENNFESNEDCMKNCAGVKPKVEEPNTSVCKLENKPGPCFAYFRRYFYNSTSEKCEEFIYGGCQGNENNFATVDDCIKVCGSDHEEETLIKLPDKCTIEKETGPCKGYNERYFFNTDTKECEMFIYGGCDGNFNNFETKQECTRECVEIPSKENERRDDENNDVPDKCSLEKETGPCRGYFERFFFNNETHECEEFIYGGCDGNENRFETKDECMKQCSEPVLNNINDEPKDIPDKCALNKEKGPCRGNFKRFFHNNATGKCEEFIYGGCQGNDNNFETIEECFKDCGPNVEIDQGEMDICKLESASGNCLAYFERYFFNASSNKCEKFIYGGCQGNENNFRTEEECLKRCAQQSGPSNDGQNSDINSQSPRDIPERCSFDKEMGTCRGYFERFYYNKETKECEMFIYGGCDGNDNNFETSEECSRECDVAKSPSDLETRQVADRCTLAKETGPCRGFFERFYFNNDSKKCERFIYGGCDGNDNRFETLDECTQLCDSGEKNNNTSSDNTSNNDDNDQETREIPNKCSLNKEKGPCRGNFKRFYYNEAAGKCQEFIYGGCHGNDNNFETVEDCQNECDVNEQSNRDVNNDSSDDVDICKLESDPGNCEALIPRFFFNSTSKKCERFDYGGCAGNKNNFLTEEECTERCEPMQLPAKCELAKNIGGTSCKTFMRRYFFNTNSRKCEPFVYRGCDGNLNNFMSLVECIKDCNPNQKYNKCTLPMETGMCMAYMERYFYNITSKTCEKFVYGGCQANENNFRSYDECNKECGLTYKISKDECLLDKEPGPCNGTLSRYFYNRKTNKCENFNYGGCLGNNNNFLNVKSCQDNCF